MEKQVEYSLLLWICTPRGSLGKKIAPLGYRYIHYTCIINYSTIWAILIDSNMLVYSKMQKASQYLEIISYRAVQK